MVLHRLEDMIEMIAMVIQRDTKEAELFQIGQVLWGLLMVGVVMSPECGRFIVLIQDPKVLLVVRSQVQVTLLVVPVFLVRHFLAPALLFRLVVLVFLVRHYRFQVLLFHLVVPAQVPLVHFHSVLVRQVTLFLPLVQILSLVALVRVVLVVHLLVHLVLIQVVHVLLV